MKGENIVLKRDVVDIAEEFGEEIGKPFNQTGASWTPADIHAFSLRLRDVRAAEHAERKRQNADNGLAQETQTCI